MLVQQQNVCYMASSPSAQLWANYEAVSPPLDSIDEFESQFSKPPYPKHGTPPPVETGSMGKSHKLPSVSLTKPLTSCQAKHTCIVVN